MKLILRNQDIDLGAVSKEELINLLRKTATEDAVLGIGNGLGYRIFGYALEAKGEISLYDTYFFNIRSMRLHNERLGSEGGNQLLKKFAEKISGMIDGNGYFARAGGDNFFALIRKEIREDFIEYMGNLTVEIEQGDTILQVRVIARMGMYDNQPGDRFVDCLDASTIALQYIRTSSDRFFVEYTPRMKELDFRGKHLRDSLNKALLDEEFVTLYQPKVNALTGEICGAEALSRWYHNGSEIFPCEYVPILEKTGAICHLDFYIFEHVCRDISRWVEQGVKPVRISSNFSKKHFENVYFVDRIVTLMDKYNVSPEFIEIELTEAYDTDDYRVLKNIVDTMHGRGIRTAIDDFGTGYSTLKLLKEIKADTVKLDKSIIDNVGHGEQSADSIALHVIALLDDLGMEIVAEGVEDDKQLEFLKQAGCNIIQSYYYSKPLVADEFKNKIK